MIAKPAHWLEQDEGFVAKLSPFSTDPGEPLPTYLVRVMYRAANRVHFLKGSSTSVGAVRQIQSMKSHPGPKSASTIILFLDQVVRLELQLARSNFARVRSRLPSLLLASPMRSRRRLLPAALEQGTSFGTTLTMRTIQLNALGSMIPSFFDYLRPFGGNDFGVALRGGPVGCAGSSHVADPKGIEIE